MEKPTKLNLKTSKKVMSVVDLISTLLSSATQAHIFHFQTTSYAAHMALGSFYDSVVDLTDELVEAYQGKYGIIKGYTSVPLKNGDTREAINFMNDLHIILENNQGLFTDSDLKNIFDEIKALVKTTLYKLENLK